MYRFSLSSNLLEFFSISCFASKLEGKHWFPNYFNSAHFIYFYFYFEKLESWNFVDTRTFNYSKIFKKKKHIFNTFWSFFPKNLPVFLSRRKTSYNKDKLVLFFPQKDESMDKVLRKFASNQMIINSVACLHKNSRKSENSVG